MSAVTAHPVTGPARPGRKTKLLVPSLQRGDIAVIDHPDMDSLCATMLIDRHVAAIINAAESLTGSYPAAGPGMLLDAHIPVFDGAGSDLLDRLNPKLPVEIRENGEIYQGNELLATAQPLTRERLEERLAYARAHISTAMEAFVHNTLSYLEQEWPLLFDERALPELKTRINGRHVLIVVRGSGYREDLQTILPYVHDIHPVLIGVDGGADALLEVGLRPDIILGDMDSVSDSALHCGAEIIVHGYERPAGSGGDMQHGDAPGMARVQQLGLKGQVLYALGTSEDVAMILSERKGARLIVIVGAHFSLQEFLDKGRKGMSSTFLARLKVGAILVDAKGVSRLYHRGLRFLDVAWLVLAALILVLVLVSVSDGANAFLQVAVMRLQLWLRHL